MLQNVFLSLSPKGVFRIDRLSESEEPLPDESRYDTFSTQNWELHPNKKNTLLDFKSRFDYYDFVYPTHAEEVSLLQKDSGEAELVCAYDHSFEFVNLIRWSSAPQPLLTQRLLFRVDGAYLEEELLKYRLILPFAKV